MPRVVHFEIVSENPDKTIEFYSKIFNWKFEKWGEEYWMVDTGEGTGINGGMIKRENPSQKQIDTINVPDIDEYIKKIEDNKGIIIMPKRAIEGVGWLAFFRDSEGNAFGIMQEDKTAR